MSVLQDPMASVKAKLADYIKEIKAYSDMTWHYHEGHPNSEPLANLVTLTNACHDIASTTGDLTIAQEMARHASRHAYAAAIASIGEQRQIFASVLLALWQNKAEMTQPPKAFPAIWGEIDAAVGRMYQAKNADQLGAAFAEAANALRAAAASIRRGGYPGLPLPTQDDTDNLAEVVAHDENARIP